MRIRQNGTLQRAATVPFPAPVGFKPTTDEPFVVEPQGQFAYLAGAGGILPLQILPDGNLRALTPARVPTTAHVPVSPNDLPVVDSIAVDPRGRSLYATDTDGYLAQYRIQADGTLLALTPGVVNASGRPILNSVACDPTGQFVYACGDSESGLVQFAITDNGTLKEMTPGSVATNGQSGPIVVTTSPLR